MNKVKALNENLGQCKGINRLLLSQIANRNDTLLGFALTIETASFFASSLNESGKKDIVDSVLKRPNKLKIIREPNRLLRSSQ
jgi:hypothetical protein